MMKLDLQPGQLSFQQIAAILQEDVQCQLSPETLNEIDYIHKKLAHALKRGDKIYGVNTGFGALADVTINKKDALQLQRHLLMSHACGVGDNLPTEVVRLIMVLKLNSFSQGYSSVSSQLVNHLLDLINRHIYPCIPSQGSVGASGDLAPLAHLGLALLGEGEVIYQGRQQAASSLINPVILQPKEGLSIINGTEVSTALALKGLSEAINGFRLAMISGCLTTIIMDGSLDPFHMTIHCARKQTGQALLAEIYEALLEPLLAEPKRTQDPYSIRCQPQVMGACYDHLLHCKNILLKEANSVTDNPVFSREEQRYLSGGNFHAEPVAMVSDIIALCMAEIGSITERRLAMLMDENFTGLPMFLASQPGLSSGLMGCQTAAAALVSENKMLCHPASVDSIPTSANQEDHVSMATHGAKRLGPMSKNLLHIISLEFLAANQGLLLKKQSLSHSPLADLCYDMHKLLAEYDDSHCLASDIQRVVQYLNQLDTTAILGELLRE